MALQKFDYYYYYYVHMLVLVFTDKQQNTRFNGQLPCNLGRLMPKFQTILDLLQHEMMKVHGGDDSHNC